MAVLSLAGTAPGRGSAPLRAGKPGNMVPLNLRCAAISAGNPHGPIVVQHLTMMFSYPLSESNTLD
jgi:hypothetical protein